jgi:hypothetical protein
MKFIATIVLIMHMKGKTSGAPIFLVYVMHTHTLTKQKNPCDIIFQKMKHLCTYMPPMLSSLSFFPMIPGGYQFQ